jgi:hypothetical protein
VPARIRLAALLDFIHRLVPPVVEYPNTGEARKPIQSQTKATKASFKTASIFVDSGVTAGAATGPSEIRAL